MRQILNIILRIEKKHEPARLESKNQAFLEEAGEQLKILARKGLSIQVFTL